MLYQSCKSLLALALLTAVSAYTPASTAGSDLLAAQSLANLTIAATNGNLKAELAKQNVTQECTPESLVTRREYSTFSNEEKLAYSSAVRCLMDTPSITPLDKAPGVRSRYDDFVATHINQTLTIHNTGNFLVWHRYFIWTFEQALRNECGYTGYLPYWNWGKSFQDPVNSPYMDGSKYSQGGNGNYSRHNWTNPLNSGVNLMPPAEGGGCVHTGPYAGYLANISASFPTLQLLDEDPIVKTTQKLSYVPRCIRRDINPWVTTRYSGDNETIDLLTNPLWSSDIVSFETRLQGNATSGFYGLHTAGHFTFGGDPGGDVYNSPNDPIFWLHHGNIDRVWWIWQNQKPIDRAFEVNGTRAIASTASGYTSIEDILDMGYNTIEGTPTAIKHHVSSMGGPYCYIYV